MNILLIAGGWSTERDVSLTGARGIMPALKSLGHTVTLFDPALSLDGLCETATKHDFAFINLHGSPGEDGLIQAILDSVGCPYQGSSPAGSFLALNKAATKQVLRHAGINTADWIFLAQRPNADWKPSLPYPLFVKANDGGSSLHLARVENKAELDTILNTIFAAGGEVLIEPAITGIEVTCGILGDEALPPILIRSVEGTFFDYQSKYTPGGATEICPAPLPEAVLQRVQETTLRAHKALGLSGYSRADYILTDDEQLFILEVNTLPGMTPTSLVPQEAAAIGIDFPSLLQRLIDLGIEKQAQQ